MKTTYISRAKFGKFTAAIAAAALLAGTAAPGVLAADYTAQLTKTIDMTAAPGAGVPHSSITFTVGTVANLPSWAAGTAVKGTAAQIKSTELTAAFTGGTVNTVTVPFTFDSDDFTAPGDYIFSLTETAAGITGLTQDTAARYIVVRVVNTDPTAPDGSLEISEVNIVNADGTAKAGEITNTYAAYGLSVVKHLSGNFANAGDEFTFTIALDDPDETPHASSVTVKTGGESADFSTITGDTVTFNADGTAEVKAGITGGEKIEVTGLPANTGYTITDPAIQRQITPPPGTASPKPAATTKPRMPRRWPPRTRPSRSPTAAPHPRPRACCWTLRPTAPCCWRRARAACCCCVNVVTATNNAAGGKTGAVG